jgi:hypothetical protein
MNAKEELQKSVGKHTIRCCEIKREFWDGNKTITIEYILKDNYTQEEKKEFLESLNFEYDDGCGYQEIFGVVWLNDFAWMRRAEYDGVEWWEIFKLPSIPEKLKSVSRILKKI